MPSRPLPLEQRVILDDLETRKCRIKNKRVREEVRREIQQLFGYNHTDRSVVDGYLLTDGRWKLFAEELHIHDITDPFSRCTVVFEEREGITVTDYVYFDLSVKGRSEYAFLDSPSTHQRCGVYVHTAAGKRLEQIYVIRE